MFEDEEGGGYYDYGTGELDNSTLSQLVGNGLDLGSFSPDILNDLRGLDYSQFNLDSDLFAGNESIDDVAAALQFDPKTYVDDVSAALRLPMNADGTYSPAKDSQYANQLIEAKAPGFEQFGGDALAGYRAPGATPKSVQIGGKTYRPDNILQTLTKKLLGTGKTPTGNKGLVADKQQKGMLETLLPLLMMAMAARKGGGASGATIPALTAEQRQTPYRQLQTAAGYRPGQGGIRYFEPMQYAPRMAGGGIVDLARLLAAQRMARGGGTERKGLLQGQGDGVSDSIPATIDGERPARLARGEYVVDARTVAELGNGSTDAGAERLDEMRKRIHAKRKKAGVGQDSRAYKDLPA